MGLALDWALPRKMGSPQVSITPYLVKILPRAGGLGPA
jgi:hypothetical protein